MAIIRAMHLTGVTAAILGLALSCTAAAQALLYEVTGDSPLDRFGWSMDEVGDVDHDGHVDFIIGAPDDSAGGLHAGRAVILSGVDGHTHLSWQGIDANHQLGFAVAGIGDLNADGTGDVLIGMPGAGTSKSGMAGVYSGNSATGMKVYTWPFAKEKFGTLVAAIGDITGDGKPDYGIGTALTDIPLTLGDDPGYMTFYKGGSVSLADGGFSEPRTHAAAGDVDGDGQNDYLVGGGGDDPLWVAVRRGITKTALDSLYAPAGIVDLWGWRAGDFDEDGTADYVFSMANGQDNQVVAQVRSLGDGVLFSLTVPVAESGDKYDMRFLATADVTGDGHPDVVACLPWASTGSGYQTGTVIGYDGLAPHDEVLRIDGQRPFEHFGWEAISLGDLDGDARDELAISAPGDPMQVDLPGVVRIYSAGDLAPPWMQFGPALSGTTTPQLVGEGVPAAGEAVNVLVSQAPADSVASLLIGFSPAMLPFKGGVLGPTPDVIIGQLLSGADGELQLHSHWPNSLVAGLTVHFQVWLPDANGPEGWTATNSIKVTTSD